MCHHPVSLAVLASALLLTACTTTAPEPPVSQVSGQTASAQTADAQQMCENALGAGRVLSAGPVTTVGELRAVKQGPGLQPAQSAFLGVAADAAAGFCWTKGAADLYDSFGVTADGQQVRLASFGGVSTVPSGPPLVP